MSECKGPVATWGRVRSNCQCSERAQLLQQIMSGAIAAETENVFWPSWIEWRWGMCWRVRTGSLVRRRARCRAGEMFGRPRLGG